MRPLRRDAFSPLCRAEQGSRAGESRRAVGAADRGTQQFKQPVVRSGPAGLSVAGDLAKGIKIFRRNMNEDEDGKKKSDHEDESL